MEYVCRPEDNLLELVIGINLRSLDLLGRFLYSMNYLSGLKPTSTKNQP